jgi:hypothetical protein
MHVLVRMYVLVILDKPARAGSRIYIDVDAAIKMDPGVRQDDGIDITAQSKHSFLRRPVASSIPELAPQLA